MLVSEFAADPQVLGLQVIEFLHSPPAHEECCFAAMGVVDLAQSVASPDVVVVLVVLGVDLVLQGPLLVQRDVLQVYVRQNGVTLVHYLYLLILLAHRQVFVRLTDVDCRASGLIL